MDLAEQKRVVRTQAHALRRAQLNKDELSRQILAKFLALREYQDAGTVLFYVDVRDEVRTHHELSKALISDKRVVVPYCVDAELKLFPLTRFDELEPGAFGILEPKLQLRGLPNKLVGVEQLDVIMVPGVAFDRRGTRLGHGYGYYDKLLRHARPGTFLVALAFECQLFSEIPTSRHDIFMDRVLTELAVYGTG